MKPIAQILREKALQQLKAKKENANKTEKSLSKLEEEIAKLEGSVKKESSSDESSSGSDSNSEESDSDRSDSELIEEEDSDDGLVYEKDKKGNIIRIVSKLEKEARIAPLPKELLPQTRFADKANVGANPNKRKISFADEGPSNKRPHSGPNHFAMKTIQQLLQNYEAPKEKIPFYCKICKFQGKNLEDFNNHRASEFHRLATMMERRVSYCKTCRKQFTSPEQLTEHNKGKAHLERLEMIREAHQSLGTPSQDAAGYDRRQFTRD